MDRVLYSSLIKSMIVVSFYKVYEILKVFMYILYFINTVVPGTRKCLVNLAIVYFFKKKKKKKRLAILYDTSRGLGIHP